MSQTDYLLFLQQVLTQLQEATRWLERSLRQCAPIGIKENYTPEEYDHFEALTGRFARVSDILIQKVYRSIDRVEFENGGTLIDVINRAEKRNLIENIDDIRIIKDLRNSIAHEYIDAMLMEIFQDTLTLTPALLGLVRRAENYCRRYTKDILP